MNLPIYIPYDTFNKNFGGSYSFLINFKNFLKSQKINTCDSIERSRIIFFPMYYDINILNKFKQKGGKIIQRLDGIYYPTKHGKEYNKINKVRKESYELADFVIFQSEYSKKQCFTMFGEKSENEHIIIINGANKEVFYPNKKGIIHSKVKFITTGGFRNADMLVPIISAFDEIDELDFELHIIGEITNKEIESYIDRPYIKYHGYKKLTEIAELLRISDVFIYSHLNPPCPNSIIEAISCGLPIVGFNSGSMSELCFFSRDLLADVSGNIYQLYNDLNYKNLKEKIILVTNNLSYYQEIALKYSYLYDFNDCGSQYLKIMRSVLEQKSIKLPVSTSKIQDIEQKIITTQKISNLIKRWYTSYIMQRENLPNEFERIIKNYLCSTSSFSSLTELIKLKESILNNINSQANRYYNNTIQYTNFEFFNYICSTTKSGQKLLFLNFNSKNIIQKISEAGRNCYISDTDSHKKIEPFLLKSDAQSSKNITDAKILQFDLIVLDYSQIINVKLEELIIRIKNAYSPNRILFRQLKNQESDLFQLKRELGLFNESSNIPPKQNLGSQIKNLIKVCQHKDLIFEDLQINTNDIWITFK